MQGWSHLLHPSPRSEQGTQQRHLRPCITLLLHQHTLSAPQLFPHTTQSP